MSQDQAAAQHDPSLPRVLNVQVEVAAYNFIMELLGEQPHKVVSGLMASLNAQATAQVQAHRAQLVTAATADAQHSTANAALETNLKAAVKRITPARKRSAKA